MRFERYVRTLPSEVEEDKRPRGCFEVVAEDFPRSQFIVAKYFNYHEITEVVNKVDPELNEKGEPIVEVGSR